MAAPVEGFVRALQDVPAERGKPYAEFVRVPALSVGVYRLSAGGTDPQGPHAEDEVYHVVRGRARLRIGDEDHAVGPGTVAFVPAEVPHWFHAIEEDLEVLVFFAPAESRPTGP